MHYPVGNALRAVTAAFCALLLAVLVTSHAGAQEARPLKGVALVIGQSAYETLAPLPNTERDARAIEGVLAKLGFETTLATDENRKKLRRSVNAFVEDAEGADVALVYYSGHGIEAGGENYLIPIDAEPTSLAAADKDFVSLQEVLDRLRDKARITILLLDACRSNPFPGEALLRRDADSPGMHVTAAGLGVSKGMTVFDGAASSGNLGEVIGFAAEPGQVALDGRGGGHSPYAAALLKHLGASEGYEFGQMMTMVTEEVYLATGARQRPWISASLRRLLSFGGQEEAASPDETLLTGERRKLLLSIAATPGDMRTFVEQLAKDRSLPLDPLYGMLRSLGAKDIPKDPQAFKVFLENEVKTLKAMLEQRDALKTDDPEIVRLTGAATRAIEQGAIVAARQYLDEAVEHVEARSGAVDEAEEAVKKKRLEEAAVYARRAEASALNYDSPAVARDYAVAFSKAAKWDEALAWRYLMEQARATRWFDKPAAVVLYQRAVDYAPEDLRPANWALTQELLGDTLNELSSSARTTFEGQAEQTDLAIAFATQAAAAYGASLRHQTLASHKECWAGNHFKRGEVLTWLQNQQTETSRWKEIVAEYEAALKFWTEQSAPAQFAIIQTRIAYALLVSGIEEDGSAQLYQAVERYRTALRAGLPLFERSINARRAAFAAMARAPEQRIAEQIPESARPECELGIEANDIDREKPSSVYGSLADALLLIGERQDNKERISEAVMAYRTALLFTKRPRAFQGNRGNHLPWPRTQEKLAIALTALGRRESGTERFEEAVTAFRRAISGYDKFQFQTVFVAWAKAHQRLGNTLVLIGETKEGTEELEEAVTAYRTALSVFTPKRFSYYWASTQEDLGRALQALGTRTHSRSVLTEAWYSIREVRTYYQQSGNSSRVSENDNLLKELELQIARL